jgi:2-dehydropantoate 2-reductase
MAILYSWAEAGTTRKRIVVKSFMLTSLDFTMAQQDHAIIESVTAVAVVGLGSIGTVFAAHLIAAGKHEVMCCVRAPFESLTVEGEYGRIEVEPVCLTDPALAKPVDWLLLATKSQDTASTAPWLDRLCVAETVVVVLQNGVEQEKRVGAISGPATILPSVVFSNARKLARGHIRHLCPERDLLVPASPVGSAFAELFNGTRLIVNPDSGFITSSWQKFLVNVVANPLTAISGRGIEVFRGGAMEELALAILREAAAVGRSCGAKFGPDIAESTLKWMSKYPGDTGTSMLQDRRDGRPLELEALNGTVVRLGRQLGIPTPVNQIICTLLGSMS